MEACHDVNHKPGYRWKFMRFRKDKPYANHVSTVERIVKSIEDNVDSEQVISLINCSKRMSWRKLLLHVNRIRECWKERSIKTIKQ